MVSAACLVMNGNLENGTRCTRAIIEVICAIGDDSTQKMLLNRLLVKIEGICMNFGFTSLYIDIPEWRGDLLAWAAAAGFDENCGELIIASHDNGLIIDTILLGYEKVLKSQSSSSQRKEPEIDLSEFEPVIASTMIADDGGDGIDANMKSIFTDLFVALHKEYNV